MLVFRTKRMPVEALRSSMELVAGKAPGCRGPRLRSLGLGHPGAQQTLLS